MSNQFHNISYKNHEGHYENVDRDLGSTWGNKDSVDYWRHERMYSCLNPIIDSYKGAKWLTIGDGRYGTDANYILSRGEADVVATDIADTFLQIAQEKGFITKYKVENAEKLSFEDDSFDFVLCKEAYHHFPRPMVALNEFLRVARKGVILIEPRDHNIVSIYHPFMMALQGAKNLLKKLAGKTPYYEFGNYETVGNYVYTISEREIEKVALGLNYDAVAFKGLNDFYLEGVETELRNENGTLFQKVSKEIQNADKRVKKGKSMTGMLIAIILKETPSNSCKMLLETDGFMVKKLPKNPYL